MPMSYELPPTTDGNMKTPDDWYEPVLRFRDSNGVLWGHWANGMKMQLDPPLKWDASPRRLYPTGR